MCEDERRQVIRSEGPRLRKQEQHIEFRKASDGRTKDEETDASDGVTINDVAHVCRVLNEPGCRHEDAVELTTSLLELTCDLISLEPVIEGYLIVFPFRNSAEEVGSHAYGGVQGEKIGDEEVDDEHYRSSGEGSSDAGSHA